MTSLDPRALTACARGEISLASALGFSPESLAATRALAGRCAAHGRDDLARTLLEGCVALDESHVWSFRALADVTLRLGDAHAAHAAATRAVTLSRAHGAADPDTVLALVRALLALARTDEARTLLAALPASLSDPRTSALARALGRGLAR